MTHQEEYDKIINFRKANPLPKDQYGENHPGDAFPCFRHGKCSFSLLESDTSV